MAKKIQLPKACSYPEVRSGHIITLPHDFSRYFSKVGRAGFKVAYDDGNRCLRVVSNADAEAYKAHQNLYIDERTGQLTLTKKLMKASGLGVGDICKVEDNGGIVEITREHKDTVDYSHLIPARFPFK
ncbi:MAG: hypothetical protein CMH26_04045 [Micavibrio sp.]|nr:hypothetical protein [Micavibrio sp.]|tara:strand:- start:1058 stop:1441 length:384 start_codon:yes stop_codon:yes gene_type:complete